MDWDTDRINRLTALEFYEKDAMWRKKKSNRYTAFCRCAYGSYKQGSYEYKKLQIYQVTGRRMLPSSISIRRIVNRCWTGLSDEKKAAWNARAVYLTEQAKETRNLTSIPSHLRLRDHDELIVECLQEELEGLIVNLRSFIVNKIMSTSAKKNTLFMPHPIAIESEIYKEFSMSALMRKTLMGDDFDKCHIHEHHNINQGRKLKPGYFHISSPYRLKILFNIADTDLMVHTDNKNNQKYVLTSIVNFQDENGTIIKGYGWSETYDSITFIYNNGESTDRGQFITYHRPEFEVRTEKTCSKRGRQANKKVYEYILPQESMYPTDDPHFIFLKYQPVCIKVHLGKANVFNLLGARLCYEERDNEIFVVNNFSS